MRAGVMGRPKVAHLAKSMGVVRGMSKVTDSATMMAVARGLPMVTHLAKVMALMMAGETGVLTVTRLA